MNYIPINSKFFYKERGIFDWDENYEKIGSNTPAPPFYFFNQANKLKDENIKTIHIRVGSMFMLKSDLLRFLYEVLPYIEHPVNLITTDGTLPLPSSLNYYLFDLSNVILNHPMIKKWYIQNYDGSIIHDKIKSYPLGLDLHTPRKIKGIIEKDKFKILQLLIDSKKYIKPFSQRKHKILADFHLTKSNSIREVLKNKYEHAKHIDFLEKRITQEELWKLYGSYKYVLSPPGMGLDCHRTWETIYFGSIPIVENNSLHPLYNDIAVVELENWDDLLNYNNLSKWENENKEKNTGPEVININNWKI